MKLESVEMLEAFKQGDTQKIVQIMFNHFNINIPDIEVRAHQDPSYGEYTVRLWVGPEHYSWSMQSGFDRDTDGLSFRRRNFCAILIP